MGQQLFTLLYLEKLERCEIHFTLKLVSFFVSDNIRIFYVCRNFTKHSAPKKGASLFSYVDILQRCEDSPVPSWISWIIFFCYSFSITILPIFHRNRLFSNLILLYVRIKFHFSPFNAMFLGHFLKRKNWKWKSK